MRLLQAYFFFTILISCAPADSTRRQGIIVDPTREWARHTIYDGLLGADGVDSMIIDGVRHYAVPWEGSAKTTLTSGLGTSIVANSVDGAEGAEIADVDNDGIYDVITATEGKKVVISFGNGPQVTISNGVQRWMVTAFDSLSGRLWAGGKTSPASVGYFTSSDWRTGPWTYTPVRTVGWAMSLELHDMNNDGLLDVVLSDRTYIAAPSPLDYTKRGDHVLLAPNWVDTTAGAATNDHKMLEVVDLNNDGFKDIISTRSKVGVQESEIKYGPNYSVVAQVPLLSNFGQYQDVAACDLDLDGVKDLIYSASSADGALLGVGALLGPDYTTQVNISGSVGTKYDNLECIDMDNDGDVDIVTTEQVEQLGLIWYENANMASDQPDGGC